MLSVSPQAHDGPIRSMRWSHNGEWMVTTDDRGFVKYWQSNFNNVHTFQAHSEPIRCSRWDSVTACTYMYTYTCVLLEQWYAHALTNCIHVHVYTILHSLLSCSDRWSEL